MEHFQQMFTELERLVRQGVPINGVYSSSTLYEYLDSYYQRELFSHEESIPAELLLPLADRTSGIFPQLEWMFAHGVDPNAGGEYRPLMCAVGHLDAFMTEYLLERGADPMHTLSPESDSPYGCGNCYIDSLDAILLEESFSTCPDAAVFDTACRIAVLLAKRGVADISTHCISISKNPREVRICQATTKF